MAAKKGKKLITVDFTGVSASGGTKAIAEGPTKFEVIDVSEEESQEGKEYLKLTLKVAEGEDEGVKVYDNCSLQPQSLWKLRSLMEAGGLETQSSKMQIDPDELVGLVVMADVIHEEYKGKTQNKINGSYYEVKDDGESTKEDAAEKTTSGPVRKKSASAEEAESGWRLKQAVTFKEGKKTLEGVITEIDGNEITVKVGKEEYVCGPDDLTAA